MVAKKLKSGPSRIDINRRTALKTIGVGFVGTVGLSGNAVAQPPPTEPTWGSDGTDHWQLKDANAPTPSNHKSHRPLYGIAPANGAHSPHSPGHGGGPAHDHVVDTPGSGKAFTANWHVYLLQENVDGSWVFSNGGFTEPPPDGPTVSKIDALVDSNADFRLVDTGFEFTCPVRPHNPTDE